MSVENELEQELEDEAGAEGGQLVDRDRLISWLNLEEPSNHELACMDELEHGDYEIYAERLRLILDEGKDVFVRSGVSQLLVSGDLAVCLYTPEGDLVESNAGAYLHSVTGIPPLKYIVNNFDEDPTVGIEPGDVFYANDALYGGIHNPDQIAYMPIFSDGELMAWASAAVHTTETGAIDPGGMPVEAHTRHDEGMKLPPMKIGENYQLKNDVVEMQRNFISRAPRMHEIDLRARVTACDRVRKRIKSLIIEERGADFFTGLIRRNITEAREGSRERISDWNDGVYETVHFADTIGLEDQLWRLKARLEKDDDELHFDYTGTSPENGGPYNAHPVAAIAHTANYLFQVPFHDLPKSNGTYDMIDFTIPKGSIIYPDEEACTAQAVMVGRTLMSSTSTLFSRMMFDSDDDRYVSAPFGDTGSGYAFGGKNQRGIPVADMLAQLLNTEGSGGRKGMDGVDQWGFPWCPFGEASNIEFIENQYPFLVTHYRHWKDSCGHGKHRGGIGMQIGYMMHHVPRVNFLSIAANSHLHTGQGLFGGYPARVIPGLTFTNNDLKEMMEKGDEEVPESLVEWVRDRPTEGDYNVTHHARGAQPYNNGDVFGGFSSGGNGYGDVIERDPEAIMDDIRRQRITHWTASNVYSVEYDEESLTVDDDATEVAREELIERRLEDGVPFEEFAEEWEEREPPDHILKNYGRWPDGEKQQEIMRM